MTLSPHLFQLIVPDDNSFASGYYAGIFHFRFWKFGKWVDVAVDDRLPTRNGRLIFMRSVDEIEMWSALLEKAYAKIHGSYDKLIGGQIIEALEDFTGGLSETCRLEEEDHSALYPVMSKAFSRNSFLGCSIDAEMDEIEGEGPLGLVKGHAYSITGIRSVIWDPSTKGKKGKSKSGKGQTGANGNMKNVRLLRIRNPWGDSTEWQGPWSDGSKEWEELHDSVLKEFDITFSADGEFWVGIVLNTNLLDVFIQTHIKSYFKTQMCYEDFLQHFHSLEICNLGPDVMDEIEQAAIAAAMEGTSPPEKRKKWVMSAYDGKISIIGGIFYYY